MVVVVVEAVAVVAVTPVVGVDPVDTKDRVVMVAAAKLQGERQFP